MPHKDALKKLREWTTTWNKYVFSCFSDLPISTVNPTKSMPQKLIPWWFLRRTLRTFHYIKDDRSDVVALAYPQRTNLLNPDGTDVGKYGILGIFTAVTFNQKFTRYIGPKKFTLRMHKKTLSFNDRYMRRWITLFEHRDVEIIHRPGAKRRGNDVMKFEKMAKLFAGKITELACAAKKKLEIRFVSLKKATCGNVALSHRPWQAKELAVFFNQVTIPAWLNWSFASKTSKLLSIGQPKETEVREASTGIRRHQLLELYLEARTHWLSPNDKLYLAWAPVIKQGIRKDGVLYRQLWKEV